MSPRSVTHATFTIERVYPASVARVYAAFADKNAKRRWFSGPPEWGPEEHELDFRVGGREFSAGGPVGGQRHIMNALYYDIVPEQRIVWTYEMHLDDTRISVSLNTVTFHPEGKGTRLVFTEQGTYIDSHASDGPDLRQQGTEGLLDQLGASL